MLDVIRHTVIFCQTENKISMQIFQTRNFEFLNGLTSDNCCVAFIISIIDISSLDLGLDCPSTLDKARMRISTMRFILVIVV